MTTCNYFAPLIIILGIYINLFRVGKKQFEKKIKKASKLVQITERGIESSVGNDLEEVGDEEEEEFITIEQRSSIPRREKERRQTIMKMRLIS